MKTEPLQEVLSWMKGTDLVEVSYNDGKKGFSLATAQAPRPAPAPAAASRYTPVCSPGVGLFQWNEPGQPRRAQEGAAVAEGDLLGLVETGPGAKTKVSAPRAGRLARVFIEAGSPVEYGTPLFFIEG